MQASSYFPFCDTTLQIIKTGIIYKCVCVEAGFSQIQSQLLLYCVRGYSLIRLIQIGNLLLLTKHMLICSLAIGSI